MTEITLISSFLSIKIYVSKTSHGQAESCFVILSIECVPLTEPMLKMKFYQLNQCNPNQSLRDQTISQRSKSIIFVWSCFADQWSSVSSQHLNLSDCSARLGQVSISKDPLLSSLKFSGSGQRQWNRKQRKKKNIYDNHADTESTWLYCPSSSNIF